MLTAESYVTGTLVYVAAALLATGLAYRFWFKVLPPMVARVLVALLLAWLITPAQPSAGAETLAPALVVAVFNWVFGEGWAAARQAAVLLGLASGVAVLLALATALWPKRSQRQAEPTESR